MKPHDIPVPAGNVFPTPDLPPAFAGYDGLEVANDRDGVLITAWIAVHGTSDQALRQLVPPQTGDTVLRRRYKDATKMLIGRIHSCIPFGARRRYSDLCGVGYETARRWSYIRFVAEDASSEFEIDAFLARSLENLPRPIPRRMLTSNVKRDLVLGYQLTNIGSQVAFLNRFGISRSQIVSWKAAMTDGDLDNNLVPRKIGSMTTNEAREIVKLRKQKAALERENQHLKDHNESLTRALRGDHVPKKDFDQLQQVVDALGKAIATMPGRGVDSDAVENTSPTPK